MKFASTWAILLSYSPPAGFCRQRVRAPIVCVADHKCWAEGKTLAAFSPERSGHSVPFTVECQVLANEDSQANHEGRYARCPIPLARQMVSNGGSPSSNLAPSLVVRARGSSDTRKAQLFTLYAKDEDPHRRRALPVSQFSYVVSKVIVEQRVGPFDMCQAPNLNRTFGGGAPFSGRRGYIPRRSCASSRARAGSWNRSPGRSCSSDRSGGFRVRRRTGLARWGCLPFAAHRGNCSARPSKALIMNRSSGLPDLAAAA